MKIRILFFFLMLCSSLFSANRYWVGGSGTWDASSTTNWSSTDGGSAGASAPTNVDDVYFTSSSGLSSNTITVSAGAVCNNFTWSATVGTISFSASTYVYGDFLWSGAGGTMAGSSSLYLYGSLTLHASMTFTNTSWMYFRATTAGKTINSAGKTLSYLDFSTSGSGDWTLAANLTTSGWIWLTSGTLSFSTYTVTSSNQLYNSGGTLNLGTGNTVTAKYFEAGSTATVNFGTSNLTLTGYANTGYYEFVLNSATTISGTPTLTFTGANNTQAYFIEIYLGGKTINSITLPSVTYPIYFYDGGTITSNFTVNAGNFLIFESAKTFTLSGTVTATGTCSNYITMMSSLAASAATFTVGAAESWNYVQMKDITETAGGSSITCTNCVNAGTNTNITFTTPRSGTTLYWIGNGTNGSGSWSSGNSWSSVSSNGAALGCVPTLVDAIVFDATSFDATTRVVTVDANMSFASMTWTGIVNSPTFTNSSNYYAITTGSITLHSSIGTFTNNGDVIFHGTGTQKITCASKTLTTGTLVLKGSGTYYLEDDAYFGSLDLETGTLDHRNQAATTSYDMYVLKNWDIAASGNTYTNRSKTVTFNGGYDSYIYSAAYSFYNLTVNKSSSNYDVITSANVVITNQLLVSAGRYYNSSSKTTTVNSGGTVSVNGASAILDVRSGTFNYSDNSTANFSVSQGVIQVTGGTLNVGVTNTNTTTVLNVGNSSGSGDASLLVSSGTLNIADKLLVNSDGIFNVSGGTVNIKATTNNVGSTSSKWYLNGDFRQSSGTINVLGAYNSTSTYPAIDFSGASATTTAGNITGGTIVLKSTTTGVTTGYYVNWGGKTIFNLTNSTSGATYTQLTNALVMKGSMTIDAGVTYAASNLAISIATDWTNNGTFTPGTNTVTFNGTSTLTTGGNGAGKAFYNVTLNGTSATLAGNIDIDNAFTITSGTWDVSASNYSMNVGGNWSNSGTFTPRSGTVTFDGTSTITTGGTGAGKIFYNVTNSGTSTLAGNIDIDNHFTLSGGTWDVSASNYTMNVGGDFVNSSGTFTCRAGTVTFDGSSTQRVNVTSAGGTTPRNADITFYNVVIGGTDVKLYYDDANSRIINTTDFTVNSGKQGSIIGI